MNTNNLFRISALFRETPQPLLGCLQWPAAHLFCCGTSLISNKEYTPSSWAFPQAGHSSTLFYKINLVQLFSYKERGHFVPPPEDTWRRVERFLLVLTTKTATDRNTKYGIMHRTTPQQRIYLIPNSNSTEIKKLQSSPNPIWYKALRIFERSCASPSKSSFC